MQVIDIHEHVINKKGFLLPSDKTVVTGAELVELMDRHGIDKAVVLPLSSPETYHFVQSNEEVFEAIEPYPGRFIPFCNVDPRAEMNDPDHDFSRVLEYYKGLGCKGLGEFTANLPWEDPRVQNLLSACAAVGFPVTVHLAHHEFKTYGIVGEPGLYEMERTMQHFPDLIILGHSPDFWNEVEPPREKRETYPKHPVRPGGRLPELLRNYENLWGDLSAGSGYNALSRDPEWGYGFMEEFQDKLLFGLDICQPQEELSPLVPYMNDALANGHISRTVYEKIMGGNAIRLLGLE